MAATRPNPRLILVRHGQASLGSADYDQLSPMGQQQSVALAERLSAELDDNATSWRGSLKRHAQTLERLNRPRQAEVEPALNEYAVAQLVQAAVEQAPSLGLTPPDEAALADPVQFLQVFLDWFPDVLSCWQEARLVDAHNGTWADFHQRVRSPIPRWQHQLGHGQSVLVVTSAGVISTVLAELLGEDLVWQRQTNVDLYNASVSVVEWQQSRWQLCELNCTAHLSATQRTMA